MSTETLTCKYLSFSEFTACCNQKQRAGSHFSAIANDKCQSKWNNMGIVFLQEKKSNLLVYISYWFIK